MSQPNKPIINPFEVAKTSTDITIVWTLDDMQALKPEWSSDRCKRFMERHSERFARGMMRMGLDMLRAIAADPNLGADVSEKITKQKEK